MVQVDPDPLEIVADVLPAVVLTKRLSPIVIVPTTDETDNWFPVIVAENVAAG